MTDVKPKKKSAGNLPDPYIPEKKASEIEKQIKDVIRREVEQEASNIRAWVNNNFSARSHSHPGEYSKINHQHEEYLKRGDQELPSKVDENMTIISFASVIILYIFACYLLFKAFSYWHVAIALFVLAIMIFIALGIIVASNLSYEEKRKR